jgi:predicted aldo/keto reductase-like oxidoreductase
MQYRDFGKTGFKVSLLGIGCMRFPFADDKGTVEREKAYELVLYAANNGVNYFDTAMGYHGGDSERILGEALALENGLREKVWITTKHCGTDYLDTYLMHGIGPGIWDSIQENDIWGEFEKFKNEGLIRHIGFSYHGQFPTFKEVCEKYPWEMCLIQQNLLDVNREVTEQAIFTAHKNNMAIAIMEPLRGGGLVRAPKAVADIYDNYAVKRSAAEWAFRHLVNYPEIGTIVSGMSTLEQLKENIEMFSKPDMLAGCLSDEEKNIIISAREAYNSIVTIPCTECGYCTPCCCNVDIPGAFRLYNDGQRFNNFDQPKRSYMFARRGGRGVGECTACGECIPKCPQGINIPKELQTAHKALDGWEE